MISEQQQGATLRIGRIVKTHPSDHSVDMVMLDDGSRMANVQVISPTASTRSGRIDLPEPDKNAENEWSTQMTGKHDALGIVAMMNSTPICLGFLYPQVNQLAMPEETKNLRIDRHSSDFYQTIDDSANMAMHHPGGSYFSIGNGPSNLEGKDFDKKWKIERNKTDATITLYAPGESVIVISKSGIEIRSSGPVSIRGSKITLN